jgi:carbonic anhydrase
LGHALQFQYHPSSIDLFNNGHTVQANLEEENTLLADGKTYSLKQIHFHEPSEHHIDGIIFPMEMHMVHADSAGKLLVVGVFIKEGPANPYLQTFWDELPAQPETHQHPDSKCKVEYLLPEHKAVYHYTGSLTTPPCTEGVEWFVMEEPIALSKKQIAHFRDLYHGNNRPVQQQTRRQVELLSD